MLVPICLFTYNRLDETILTINALKSNYLAEASDLYIFSDGGKNESASKKIEIVRKYLKTITGFKSITIFESETNKGLANSIITGVTKILDKHEKIIVLEDDLITSPNFLDFMNQSLNFYKNDANIFSISGYTFDLKSLPIDKDFYFGYRASSWGWAIWKNRWEIIDWQASDYHEFSTNKTLKKRFNRGGSDMSGMLRNQMESKIDSWAIRFCYHQFNQDLKTVFPNKSKVQSIGFSKEATHTSGTKRFITELDEGYKTVFKFEIFDEMNNTLVKEFQNKFSIKTRLLDKINQIIQF
ncbi:glycosyltransferase family protein [Algibacter lectus]|uniref:Glycosyl transferase family 2 n=1 Tax=Algibacter lectus TaxID=221126 RepID=A0A4R8M8X0_9FLAO|nr:glycosyltransferase [Algibacter lectus]MWW25906.1 glycosyltransferase [Algibacter lectus]TDY60632.1 glycosyl transferase family 2 [Algibacter lectus]